MLLILKSALTLSVGLCVSLCLYSERSRESKYVGIKYIETRNYSIKDDRETGPHPPRPQIYKTSPPAMPGSKGEQQLNPGINQITKNKQTKTHKMSESIYPNLPQPLTEKSEVNKVNCQDQTASLCEKD